MATKEQVILVDALKEYVTDAEASNTILLEKSDAIELVAYIEELRQRVLSLTTTLKEYENLLEEIKKDEPCSIETYKSKVSIYV